MFCIIQKIVFIFAAGNDKSHITMSEINQTINLHVSVDCVLIGFDGEQFRVLLVRQVGKQSEDGYNNMKLPGSLIYDDEDLDEAAKRVLNELTGLKNVKLTQFKAYGSKNRTRNPKDVLWLERFHRLDEKKIDRIILKEEVENDYDFAGGEFTISYYNKNFFLLSASLYFKDTNEDWVEVKSESQPRDMKYLTGEAAEELRAKGKAIFNIDAPKFNADGSIDVSK